MANEKYKAVQIQKKLHSKIDVLAAINDVTMKVLASRIIAIMFEKHEDEINQIVKDIKIRKT